MNRYCNIFKTIECILENGITAGDFKVDIRERIRDYVSGRGFVPEPHKDRDFIMDRNGLMIVAIRWVDNGLFLSAEDYKHHLVLEIIVVASDMIICDVLDNLDEDDKEKLLRKRYEKKEAEEDFDDEWI